LALVKITPHQYNQVKLMFLDCVLTKCFPNDSFDSISFDCSRYGFFTCNYPKPGMMLAVRRKTNFEMIIRNTSNSNNMAKTICAQQPIPGRKLMRDFRPQALHDPVRDALG
jgi:hypothetical protein